MTGARFCTVFRATAFGIVVAAVLTAGAASAQVTPAPAGALAAQTRPAVPTKPLWKELTQPQQVALEPLRTEWDQMDALRKQKWLEIANRYSSMKLDEQQRVQERMRDWLKLTPEERQVARENYTLSKKIDKSKKSAQWEEYQALPEEEKRKLAADAAQKKQVTNLPPKTQPNAIVPIKPSVAPGAACGPGLIKNPNPAGPACVPAPVAAPAGATAPGGASAVPTSPPAAPAAPVPNVK